MTIIRSFRLSFIALLVSGSVMPAFAAELTPPPIDKCARMVSVKKASSHGPMRLANAAWLPGSPLILGIGF